MRFFSATAIALLLASTGATAQDNCGITLPYRLEQIAACTPESAAAYDLAFCAVSYANAEEPFKTRAAAYFRISQALTDATALGKNVQLAKNYYARMQLAHGQVPAKDLEYIRQKCANVEVQHVRVMEELSKKVKAQQDKKGIEPRF